MNQRARWSRSASTLQAEEIHPSTPVGRVGKDVTDEMVDHGWCIVFWRADSRSVSMLRVEEHPMNIEASNAPANVLTRALMLQSARAVRVILAARPVAPRCPPPPGTFWAARCLDM